MREQTVDALIARAEQRVAGNAATGKAGQRLPGFKFLRRIDNPDLPPMPAQPRTRGR